MLDRPQRTCPVCQQSVEVTGAGQQDLGRLVVHSRFPTRMVCAGSGRQPVPPPLPPLRVFVSATFESRPRARALATELFDAGSQVTSRWHDDESPAVLAADEMETWALQDLADIRRSDALVVWCPPEDKGKGAGGRWAEVGFALALGKPVFLMPEADLRFIFAYHPLVKVAETAAEAIAALKAAMGRA